MSKTYSMGKLLKEGDLVRVNKGEMAGFTGRVQDITFDPTIDFEDVAHVLGVDGTYPFPERDVDFLCGSEPAKKPSPADPEFSPQLEAIPPCGYTSKERQEFRRTIVLSLIKSGETLERAVERAEAADRRIQGHQAPISISLPDNLGA